MSNPKDTWIVNVPNDLKPELLGQIIDIFEDFLSDKGITADDIPNPDRDDTEDAAIIYGNDYDKLADKIASVLEFER